jgi:hypothetical protein
VKRELQLNHTLTVLKKNMQYIGTNFNWCSLEIFHFYKLVISELFIMWHTDKHVLVLVYFPCDSILRAYQYKNVYSVVSSKLNANLTVLYYDL